MDQEDFEDQAKAGIKRLKRGTDLPEGAVFLQESDIINVYWHTVTKWKPKKEMWAFRIGPGVLGTVAALTGGMMNLHFRRQFQLRHFGRLTTFGPATMLPAILTVGLHYVFVMNRLFLHDFNCTVCAPLRSATIQAAFGFLHPLVCTPFACAVVAKNRYTIALPPLTDVGAFLGVTRRMARPFHLGLAALLATNLLVAAWITRLQAELIPKIDANLRTDYLETYGSQ